MQASKSPVLGGGVGGSAEWPPILRSFSRAMHPQALRHLDALPACPLGSPLGSPLPPPFPSDGLKKAVTSLQTSWERLLTATWVMETIPGGQLWEAPVQAAHPLQALSLAPAAGRWLLPCWCPPPRFFTLNFCFAQFRRGQEYGS